MHLILRPQHRLPKEKRARTINKADNCVHAIRIHSSKILDTIRIHSSDLQFPGCIQPYPRSWASSLTKFTVFVLFKECSVKTLTFYRHKQLNRRKKQIREKRYEQKLVFSDSKNSSLNRCLSFKHGTCYLLFGLVRFFNTILYDTYILLKKKKNSVQLVTHG